MKKYISTFLIFSFLCCVWSCNEEDYASKEYYKNVVYLLSKETYNVYSEIFPFNDGKEVIGHFSIGCGGSQSNPQEFTVELEADTVLLNRYNRGNFDIDTLKYARILSGDKYTIEKYSVKFPAHNPDQYVKVAVKVLPDGLSPDSIYFIPIAIKSVTGDYEVNEEKFNVLYRVALENYYAEQLKTTFYQSKGGILDANGAIATVISTTKQVSPISKHSVRAYVGNEIQTNKSTVDQIKKFSIVITVDGENKLQISPYGTIDVQQIDQEGWNFYEEVRRNAVDTTVNKFFHLSYQYRLLKTPATETTPAVYDKWITVQESLKKLEN